ncbi:MAG: DUF2141 domain-containing protein [Bacteroidales bacterium]
MSKIISLIGVFFFSAFCSMSQDTTGTMIIQVSGALSDSGNVKIALSNNKKEYASPDKAFRAGIADIDQGSATLRLDSIPYGSYAIKVFHDKNNNGILDTKLMGVPTEAYGFSNNPKASFGPAKWDKARFEFEEDGQVINILLQ